MVLVYTPRCAHFETADCSAASDNCWANVHNYEHIATQPMSVSPLDLPRLQADVDLKIEYDTKRYPTT